jgi:sulfate transport system substrate-binding protein
MTDPAPRRAPSWFAKLRWLDSLALLTLVAALLTIGSRNWQASTPLRLLNVSYDPTRELYRDFNKSFVERYPTAQRPQIVQSHAGSSRQARSVIAGDQVADVVTLGLPSDITALVKRGLVAETWRSRLPNAARPYSSTIVFVVRRPNPMGIHDWPDLIKPGVEIMTPDPKTSGNGKLSVLAAYGAIVLRGGSDADARAYLKQFFDHAPFLEIGARATSTAFATERLGHVHVAWENEALREVAESKGELEVVYPSISILAEPSVTWVDANVRQHHTAALAREYLEFLFSDSAQELIAKSGYRPTNQAVLQRHRKRFPDFELFSVTRLAASWDEVEQRFFAENGIIDTVYRPKPRSL